MIRLRSLLMPSLAAPALLAGCAVGPEYERPEAAAIPAAYAGVANDWKVARPQAQLSRGDWWEIFADPKLDALESQASAANQKLKAAAEQFTEARAAVDIARSGYFPNAAISGVYARQRTSADSPLETTGSR